MRCAKPRFARARRGDRLSESGATRSHVAATLPVYTFRRMKTAAGPEKAPLERAKTFTTISGRPIERLYTADSINTVDYARDINDPGTFPYTRGIHRSGYRGKLWTMRQFAGFGTPEETNERYKTLLR